MFPARRPQLPPEMGERPTVSTDLPQDLLQQMSLDELEKHGRHALRVHDYERACVLLREAANRAPLRQDLRQLMAKAVEGRFRQPVKPKQKLGRTQTARAREFDSLMQSREGRPNSTMPLPRLETPRAAQPDPQPQAYARVEQTPPVEPVRPDPVRPEPVWSEPARPRTPLMSPRGRFDAAASRGRAKLPRHDEPKPGSFERRHKRGPMSALVFGLLTGLLLAAAAGWGAWYYLDSNGMLDRVGGTGRNYEHLRLQQAFERARYIRQGDAAMAVEQLETLPPSPERDQRLAEIYMSIGDQALRHIPARLDAALEAYTQAMQYAPDVPEYGVAQAQVYYSLAREGRADAESYLQRARETLQTVIERNPQHLPAYEMLKRVATELRDYTLMQQTLQGIINNWPRDSQAAINARNDLEALGLRYEF